MSKHGKLGGLCQNCVRYNPKALAHCLLAKDAGRLARKWKYNLLVTDCELWIVPEEVFPEPIKAAEPVIDAILKKENGNDVAVNAVLTGKEEKEK